MELSALGPVQSTTASDNAVAGWAGTRKVTVVCLCRGVCWWCSPHVGANSSRRGWQLAQQLAASLQQVISSSGPKAMQSGEGGICGVVCVD